MEQYLEKIIESHKGLLGENVYVEKINVGFTNTIYTVNDSYIIKICTNTDNEENFKNEIRFYQENSTNQFIPKLYYASTSKEIIPYFYEIIEKISGVSLYNVWHTLTEEEREEIIKQLCTIIKDFHKTKGPKINWLKKFQDEFTSLYQKATKLKLFSIEEQVLLEKAFNKFEKYLESSEFVFIHNDLHFDNIFYHDGKIKIIDFERAMFAPIDFELGILYRMIKKPWKFASEETEKYTNSSDYTNIKLYLEKYYPKILNIKYLDERLAIYDLVYNLEHFIVWTDEEKLKKDILQAAKIVVLKEELTFENLTTAEELMDYMNINIEYGWLDKENKKHLNTMKGFRENYQTTSLQKVLESGIANCIEQAKLIKTFFDKMNIENKMYCYRSYETEENFAKEVRMHCFVIYKYQNNWYHFEHANEPERGITKYETLTAALKQITSGYEKNDIRKLTEIPNIPEGLSFKEFNNYVNSFTEIDL